VTATSPRLVELDVRAPVWDRFFTVAPLVLVGTREPDGRFDLAPKHMVLPLGWQNYFGFVCTPRHATYFNAWRERAFTVSFPRPDQLVEASLAASGRCDDERNKRSTKHHADLGRCRRCTRWRASRSAAPGACARNNEGSVSSSSSTTGAPSASRMRSMRA